MRDKPTFLSSPVPDALKTDEQLQLEWRQADNQIQDAYWRFTRQANAKPPVLVVPEAYHRRASIEAELRRRGGTSID